MKKVLIALLLIIAVGAAGCLFFMSNIDKPKDPESTEEISVTIPEGTGASAIGSILENNGIINSSLNFKVYLRLNHYEGVMKAGSYTLSPSMDFDQIIAILEGYETNDFTVTIPEGLTIEQTAQKLADQGAGTYEGFMDAINNGNFDYGWLKDNPLEGYLMPDTYSIPEGTTEYDIIDMMLQNFESSIVDLYKETDNKITSNYNLSEVLTAASIIERECSVADERPLVASVIYNRINDNMMLQMCSTVQYLILKETGEVKEVLTYDDTAIDSPYNTYIHYGLPPAPICSPGKACFEAALKPADTDYLFFVLSADLDGTSKFTSDYNEFLQYKDAYDKAVTGGK